MSEAEGSRRDIWVWKWIWRVEAFLDRNGCKVFVVNGASIGGLVMNWELGLEDGNLASGVVKFEGILRAVWRNRSSKSRWCSL